MPRSFAVLGAGGWGTALAVLLAKNAAHRVSLWSARPEHAGLLQERRENVRLLPGIPIPEAVFLTTDIRKAVDGAELLLVATPTVFLRTTLQRIAPDVPAATPVVSVVKGIENATFRKPTEIILETLGERPVAVLSGPSHAEEVARELPTTVVAASADFDLARAVQRAFTTERFRVYTNPDIIGVELAGALKNVIAIAAGIGDGLGLGDNAKAALITRGLVEMARFGIALGAEAATFSGLAGMGDLIVTCCSRHGRNRLVGERLARGDKLRDIQAMNMVAEGVYTTRSVYEQARKMGVSMPISTEIYRALYEDKPPLAAVNDLMVRSLKSEQI